MLKNSKDYLISNLKIVNIAKHQLFFSIIKQLTQKNYSLKSIDKK